MKISLGLISLLTLSTGPLALAQQGPRFEIVFDHSKNGYAVLKSNDYRCMGTDVAGGFIGNPENDGVFHIKDLCGVPQVDFYRRDDIPGYHYYNAYPAGGDGNTIAWCRKRDPGTPTDPGSLSCSSFECSDGQKSQCRKAEWKVDDKILCFVDNGNLCG